MKKSQNQVSRGRIGSNLDAQICIDQIKDSVPLNVANARIARQQLSETDQTDTKLSHFNKSNIS